MTGIGAGTCMDGLTPVQIESTLATIGLGAILRGTPKYPLYMAKQAANVPRDIQKAVAKYLAEGGRTAYEEPDFDYEEASKLLIDTGNEQQAGALFAAIPDAELGTEVANAATVAIRYLQGVIPRRARETIMGQRDITPSKQEMAAFERLWAVAMDPLSVLRQVAAGALSSDEVEALQACYPALYEEMRRAVVEGLAEIGAANPKWEPGHRQSVQIGILMGVESGGVDLALGYQIQELYAAEKDKKAKGVARSRAGRSNTGDSLTPAQRLDQ